MGIKRNRVIKNPNRKSMRVLDMTFSVSKDNERLLAYLQGREKQDRKE